MNNKLFVLLGLVLIPIAILGLGLAGVRTSLRPVEVGLVDGRLRPCPPLEDCVCSEVDGDQQAGVEPLSFEGDPQRAFDSLLEWLASDPNVRIVSLEEGYAHVVFFTRFLKLVDDVEFRLDAEERRIHVRAIARVGNGRIETHRARIESVRARWFPPALASVER